VSLELFVWVVAGMFATGTVIVIVALQRTPPPRQIRRRRLYKI
jgi:hypothetical protein